MSYEKFYPGGWQSGESGGTPITPEALNHIENGIKQTYSDFSPAQEDASFPGCYYRMVNGIKEWINPPMVPGVEYRTTKRSNGMPVYTMAVDCGNMPDGDSHKSVEAYCNHTGWVYPISCIGNTSIGTTIPIKFVDGNEQWIGATKGNYEGHINIDMYGGVAKWTATATVEYVKL